MILIDDLFTNTLDCDSCNKKATKTIEFGFSDKEVKLCNDCFDCLCDMLTDDIISDWEKE